MLNCNIIQELYNIIKKRQFGICNNTTLLFSLYSQQLRLDLQCSGVTICYVPDICEAIPSISCSITTSQNITPVVCNITLTQNT